MITVVQAPAYLAIQDLGWPASRSAGMPVSGAMDRWALRAANLRAGNPSDAAGLEWALTGGRLRFGRDATFAICGPGVSATGRVTAGSDLELPRPSGGRFLYLAVNGGMDVPSVLGSRSTYRPAGFGHLLRVGATVPLGTPSRGPGLSPAEPPDYQSGSVRVVAGPQRHRFADGEWERFLGSPWTVSRASDRMGYRLEGAAGLAAPTPDQPSEAACVGAVQVPASGMPIVLMPDGPTVGGYPKIAVVITADLPILAQRLPGAAVRFRPVSIAEAQREVRRQIRGAPGAPPLNGVGA